MATHVIPKMWDWGPKERWSLRHHTDTISTNEWCQYHSASTDSNPVNRVEGLACLWPSPQKESLITLKGDSTNKGGYSTIQHKPTTNEWHQFQLDSTWWGLLCLQLPLQNESSISCKGREAAQTKVFTAQSSTNLAQPNDTSFNSIRQGGGGLPCLQPPTQNPQYPWKGSSTNKNIYGTIQHKPSTNEWHLFHSHPWWWGGARGHAPGSLAHKDSYSRP